MSDTHDDRSPLWVPCTDVYLIPPGPGHLDSDALPYGVHAFVGLTLDYLNAHPGATRAVLHLLATDADEGHQDHTIGMELTRDDLVLLQGTISSLLTAIKEDDE